MDNHSDISGSELTVVVPVRNRGRLLRRCLDSIAAQTMRPGRVIVVDNGSADTSLQVAEEWAKTNSAEDFKVEVTEEPRAGATLARNRGLEMVESEYVLFFDSDDVMLPNLVEHALTAIQNRDIVYWKALEIDEEGDQRVKKFLKHNPLHAHFFCCVLCTVCFMARTALVRKAGGWCENAAVWNDWELGIRMLLERPRVKPLTEILTHKYSQRESITGTSFSGKSGDWENTLNIVERTVRERAKAKGFDEERLLGMTDYRRVVLAAHYWRENSHDISRALLSDALHRSELQGWKKMLLRVVYHYTRIGGRGAYLIWR